MDISARQIELARQNVPGGAFFHADMGSVSFPPGTFDAVVSFYAIGCIPRDEHAALLRHVHGWLRPGGWLLLSEEDADRPDVVGEWLGVPMFFTGFNAATQRQLVEEAGFVVERAAVETQVEQGIEVPFSWVLARVPE